MSLNKEVRNYVEKIQYNCQKDLRFLARDVLGMKDWGPIHDELARFMETSGRRKHIELARGHLKSSIVTKAWSIQQVLRNPDIRVLIANAVWDNSRKFLRTIQKHLIPGSLLSQAFGNFQSEHWNQDECTIRQRTAILDAPTWATTGIEKEQTSQHYDLIIADDLVARENVGTPEQRQKVKLYYKDLLDLLEPDGTLVVIGTRWHQDDLYSKLIEDGGWDNFIRTAYTDETRTNVVFPQKFSLEYLDSLRKSKGAYEFSAQYLNNPIDESAADFKAQWVKHYDPTTPHPSHLYLTVDPAISLSRDADYSAMVVAGMFSNRKIRVVDRVHTRCVPSELIDNLFALVKKWGLHRVGIETFAFQKTLKYTIQEEQRKRGVFFSIDELGKRHQGKGEPVFSKEARIRRLQPYFEQGLIEIRSDMQDLADELLSFPRGRHDDLIDALAYQLDYLIPSSISVEASFKHQFTFSERLKAAQNRQGGEIYERYMSELRDQPGAPDMREAFGLSA